MESADGESAINQRKMHMLTVIQLDGTVVPTEQLKSLRVAVQDQTVAFPQDNTEFPTYGKRNLHPDSTKGKCGGSTKSA